MKESPLEYDLACDRLRDDIAEALLEMGRPTLSAVSRAAAATHDLADALHHAAGNPYDPRWHAALTSLEDFVDLCRRSPRALGSEAVVRLRTFLDENAVAALAAA
jgi:hypothetical protein